MNNNNNIIIIIVIVVIIGLFIFSGCTLKCNSGESYNNSIPVVTACPCIYIGPCSKTDKQCNEEYESCLKQHPQECGGYT